MKYVTGIIALGVPCSLDTCGKWNVTKAQYIDENLMRLRESDESPFKDYGIEMNKIVPYHEFCLYNVANHVRAYLDLLYEGEFEVLEELFYDCIDNGKARKDIFMCVYSKLRNLACFTEVNQFMEKEFGNAWNSFKDTIRNSAEHIATASEKYQAALASRAKFYSENKTGGNEDGA